MLSLCYYCVIMVAVCYSVCVLPDMRVIMLLLCYYCVTMVVMCYMRVIFVLI